MFLNSAVRGRQSDIERYRTLEDAKEAFDELIKNPFITDATLVEERWVKKYICADKHHSVMHDLGKEASVPDIPNTPDDDWDEDYDDDDADWDDDDE